jgi:hypothetical protein
LHLAISYPSAVQLSKAGPPSITGETMSSLGKSSLRVRFLLFFVSLTSAALIGKLLAQEHTNPAGFMRRMDASMAEMDTAMKAAPMNGDVDHDFAAMMIPHHQGAIEMAKSELLFGKDPVMRRLAQEILVDQKSEIDAMNLWLGKRAEAQHKETKR